MKTVLIVDDEPLIRAYVRDVVEEAGYKAKEACNADEALQLIEDDGISWCLTSRCRDHWTASNSHGRYGAAGLRSR